MPTKEITLPELMAQFGSEDACHEALEELRWPKGIACPRCGFTTISRIVKRRQFDCDGCRYQFSVRVGTIFQKSKLPLATWFLAVYLMCESRKSVSANQLKRMLGVTYKTAWLLCHKIREAMRDENAEPLDGIVEIDETFIGGKKRGAVAQAGKAIVMGAAERDGRVRLRLVPALTNKATDEFFDDFIENPEAVYTDRAQIYKGLGKRKKVKHKSVNHTREQWVNGQVHTNTIEGVWSLLDRSIIGAYHKVSTKHLPAYLHEVEWRYNNRQNPYLFRDTILELIDCEPMEYKRLTAARS